MTDLASPRTSPCWWLGTRGDKTVRAWARLATEAHALEADLLGYPHFSEVEWRVDPDQSEHVDEPDPERAPTEPPPPCEPSREDAVVDEFDRAVREAARLSGEHRDAVLVALDAAAGVYAYSLESQREWLRERSALLEENARLRAEIQRWRSERETDEIAVGYEPTEEVEEP